MQPLDALPRRQCAVVLPRWSLDQIRAL